MKRNWLAIPLAVFGLSLGLRGALAQEPPAPEVPPPDQPVPEEVQPITPPDGQPIPQPEGEPAPHPVDEINPNQPPPGSPPIDTPIPQPSPEMRNRARRDRNVTPLPTRGQPGAQPPTGGAGETPDMRTRRDRAAARRAMTPTTQPVRSGPTPPPAPNGQQFNVPKPAGTTPAPAGANPADATSATAEPPAADPTVANAPPTGGVPAGAANPPAVAPTPSTGLPPGTGAETTDKPRVAFDIKFDDKPLGRIMIELDPAAAPKTVENFLQYVDSGFYNDTIFHRIIADFLVQGGGYTTLDTAKTEGLRPPVENEARPTTRHERGSIAMARVHRDRNSATSQFFINLDDNRKLDRQYYTVFGTVVQGMDTIDRIGALPTEPNVQERRANTRPVKAPVISRAYRLPPNSRRRERALPKTPSIAPTPSAPATPATGAPATVPPAGQTGPSGEAPPITPTPQTNAGGEVVPPASDPHELTEPGREERPPQDAGQPTPPPGVNPPPPAGPGANPAANPALPSKVPVPAAPETASPPRGIDAVRKRNAARPAKPDDVTPTPQPEEPSPESPNPPASPEGRRENPNDPS
ncbi:MAG: peptidylprolyl isomerase [Phycisphaerae bacterium]|nr:peptidylprolyl isomerase [Phycisphaerae bacterium]